MYCPRCATEREPVNGHCPECDYNLIRVSSVNVSSNDYRLSSSQPPGRYKPTRGDILCNGRYQLRGQFRTSDFQREQSTDWIAIDSQASRTAVVIREVAVPQDVVTHFKVSQEQAFNMITQRLANIGRRSDLPELLNKFIEQEVYFLVFSHIQGNSLAALLHQGGGALPERRIAEYGYQLCDTLSYFSHRERPFVHGFINLDTVIVSHDGRSVSLVQPSLFPYVVFTGKSKRLAGYSAPEYLQGNVQPSVDLYGVTATLYHAATGSSPFERTAFFYPPARRLNPALTPGMELIFSRQLRLSIAQRYAGPEDMQKDLATLLASYPEEVEREEQPALFADPLALSQEQRRERDRSSNILNMGVFAAIIVLIILGVLFTVLHA